MRLLLGAFGDPGHTFPILALGRALHRHGHDVWVQTWARWQDDAEANGMRFVAAPEYPTPPRSGRGPLKPYAAAARVAQDTIALVQDLRPDATVADILTLGPALASERCGVPVATLIPHLDPRTEPGWPPFAMGAIPARTRAGRALWRGVERLVDRSLDLGARELDETRRRVGLAPLNRRHGGISSQLCLVGTAPQLEYPRRTPLPGTHVVGPFVWEPRSADVELPSGDGPLVVVAPSTSQDPEALLLRAALRGLADAPVRVLAARNRPDGRAGPPLDVPQNARVVPWMSYSQVMPAADVVVCHAGHGTLCRALGAGRPVVAVPAGGDMYENAARLAWSGAGIRLPRRLATPRVLRTAVLRTLEDPRYAERAAGVARWIASGDGAERSVGLIEALARGSAD